KAAEDAARRDAERKAAEDAARRDAERELVEEARRASERQAAEEAARRAAERTLLEQTARQEAQRKASEEALRREPERSATPGVENNLSEPTTIEQLAARRRAAEDKLRRQAERLEMDRRAIEQAVRSEEEERQTVEQAIVEEQKKQSLADTPSRPPAGRIKLPEETIVMIADDSRVVRVKTSRLLTANQYRVAAAEDGLDAARQIEASPPDVLVTDVDMPGLNGFQLAKMVRDNPRTAKLPIIMVTSDNEQLRAEAARIGVNIVLGKPYPEELLITQIQKLMGEQASI
ncbi:MAG TPA: response regulator, partial [Accumulibacter sp.]|nr:response regulator [Accumulibacter sp.]